MTQIAIHKITIEALLKALREAQEKKEASGTLSNVIVVADFAEYCRSRSISH